MASTSEWAIGGEAAREGGRLEMACTRRSAGARGRRRRGSGWSRVNEGFQASIRRLLVGVSWRERGGRIERGGRAAPTRSKLISASLGGDEYKARSACGWDPGIPVGTPSCVPDPAQRRRTAQGHNNRRGTHLEEGGGSAGADLRGAASLAGESRMKCKGSAPRLGWAGCWERGRPGERRRLG